MSTGSKLLRELIAKDINQLKTDGTYKKERVITSQQSNMIKVQGTDKNVLNFCANNYLGLANNKEVCNAAIEAVKSHGFGLSSVRFICGTQDLHKKLEAKISEFHKTEDAITFGSCFDANGAVFAALADEKDVLITDQLNHASIIDGIRLSKAARSVYKHMDMKDLEAKLIEFKDKRHKFIITDGVFSMDGDVAPLKEICDLADKYNAITFIDECHATGFFGKTGRGTPEYCGVEGRIDIINSTLGKALGGGNGGYTAASKEVIELLRNKARPYLFSNALTPNICGASIKVFDLIMKNPEGAVKKVRDNTHLFREKMTKAGFKLSGAFDHPIAPVWLGDAKIAGGIADALLQQGIYVIGFSFPVVPKGQARIRVQLSAAHSKEDVERCVDAFIKEGRKFKVIN